MSHTIQNRGRARIRRLLFVATVFAITFGNNPIEANEPNATTDASGAKLATATFAGGCFWCMEPPYDKLEGVFSTTSGYAGGHTPSPSYETVSAGGTGHAEVVRVIYDPQKIDYDTLLRVFWRNIDPLDAGGQFCDRGDQYRSAIFYDNEEQRKDAERSKNELIQSGRFDSAVVTEIVPMSTFYKAEDYHQNFYEKNTLRYQFYRYSCGRDKRLDALWGSENETDLSKN